MEGPKAFMEAVDSVSSEDRVLRCLAQSWPATLGKPVTVHIVVCTRESLPLKLVFQLSGKQPSTVYLKDLTIQRFAVSFGRSAL